MINIVLLYLNWIPPIIILRYIIYVDYNINVASGLMEDVLVFFFFSFFERYFQNVNCIDFDSPYCFYFLFLVIFSLLPKYMLDLLFLKIS